VSGDFPVQLTTRAEQARGSSPTCPTRRVIFLAIFLARMSFRDARVYTCAVHDKLSCTRLQNYTISTSLMSVSVSVSVSARWNVSFTVVHDNKSLARLTGFRKTKTSRRSTSYSKQETSEMCLQSEKSIGIGGKR